MKLNLFLLCLTGVAFITLKAVRRDYFLITTPATWEDAKNYCRTNFEDLAWVQTADNWYRLTAEAERKGLPVTGWIGLYNKFDEWLWINYGQTAAPTWDLNNWAAGQPDNLGGNETCAAIDATGTWLDFTCTELKPSICFDGNLGFVAITNPLRSWDQGREYCLDFHSDLAFPVTATQSSEIHQLAITHGTSWIGIYRPSWAWTNESDALEIRWRPGYPNNAEFHNNCGSLINSLVEDKVCNNTYYFFCHKPYLVRKQVMKLKILGDINVFDPATQATILQQVKQKLQDHGIMREVTVTWRVHADGNIFHKKRPVSM